MKIKEIIKGNYKYWLILVLIGIVSGIPTAYYSLESTDPAIMEEALAQIGGAVELYVVISVLQCAAYALICGVIGKLVAEKLGLWKEIRFDVKPTVISILSGLGAGAVIMAFDLIWFSNVSEVIKNSYLTKPTLINLLASVTYGGIVEELMIRLFLMSLIALVIWKLFFRGKSTVPEKVLVIANILSAILFAAGHLPSTAVTIGITPVILIRCFLLNSGSGLVFGRLYIKRGIHYAILAHIFAHIAMKLIWIFAV